MLHMMTQMAMPVSAGSLCYDTFAMTQAGACCLGPPCGPSRYLKLFRGGHHGMLYASHAQVVLGSPTRRLPGSTMCH
jgi:hypothetical protein